MKDLYLLMSAEEVEYNFQRGNFNTLNRENIFNNNFLSVDLLTIELDEHKFQFTETTINKGSKRSYSEIVLVD